MEQWADIPNYEGIYKASTLGRIKSLSRKIPMYGGRIKTTKERILTQKINNSGYYRVCLSKDGVKKSYYTHRLIYLTFNGIWSDRKNHIHHYDNNKLNNSIDNLFYISAKENTDLYYKTIKTSSNVSGVHFSKTQNKWIARKRDFGKRIHLGSFNTEEDAIFALNNFVYVR